MVNQPQTDAPQWRQALTLTERIALLQIVNHRSPQRELNLALAERRLQRWRSQPPFAKDAFFTQRLNLDGISETELHQLLGEPVQALIDRSPETPVWTTELIAAFTDAAANASELPKTAVQPAPAGAEMLIICEPLIEQGRRRLGSGLQTLRQAYAELPFDLDTVEALLLSHLPAQLSPMLSRAMALELNIARLQGLLAGDTPEERFRSFLQRLRNPATALALLQEYPVLARQLVLGVERWVTVSLEFLQRLCADWAAIQALFSLDGDPGVLVRIQGGVGDTHRGGRSVLIATFSSGQKLVYKPRPLAVDRHFQELLAWLNARGDHPPFRTLRILERDGYGWIEFVAYEGCTDAEEIQRFYQRQGAYLALLYALAATDFHHENLIAAGEHPVLLDLEALFHPHLAGLDSRQADQMASSVLADSVLSVGLLPQRIWSKAEAEGIDISGLGGAGGQLTPYQLPQWEGLGTDEMHLTRKRVTTRGAQNRPLLHDAGVNPLDHIDAILAGFCQLYALLLNHRDQLLAADGPLAHFAQDEVRVILRATRTYALLLRESFHPDVLRNGLDRDRLFDRLWSRVEQFPYLAKVIAAERADLQLGDIPLFTTRPTSRALWSSGNGQITDFFDEPSLTLAARRLSRLSDADREQQLWIIRASLATLANNPERATPPSPQVALPQPAVELIQTQPERLFAAACAIGDRLETLALRNEHNLSWLGMTLENDHGWSLMPLGLDLYGGLPGVALFLAYLGAVTHTKRYTILAQAATATLRHQLERSDYLTQIGGFSGWGGVIYTLAHLGVLWQQPAVFSEAEALVERLSALIEQDDQFDIIGGAAGCIGGLLALHHSAPSPRTLATAIQCGDHLLARAQPQRQGIAWSSPIAQQPLAGMAHGVAGIAWALFELAAVSGERRFWTAACAAIDYERTLFSPEAGNWLDLREWKDSGQSQAEHEHHFMTAWCHGAAGIGLARLQTLTSWADTHLRGEIDLALQTTLATGFGRNHSLCHGDLGNLELLLQTSESYDPQWHSMVRQKTELILNSIHQDGWRCGLPLGVESPGLMIGLAGIGYGLLRLAAPTRVPAVLVLAPPVLVKER